MTVIIIIIIIIIITIITIIIITSFNNNNVKIGLDISRGRTRYIPRKTFFFYFCRATLEKLKMYELEPCVYSCFHYIDMSDLSFHTLSA
jgi:uncharacterized membrane protein